VKDVPEQQVIADVEREFKIWFEKYPVPLMVFAFDVHGNVIHLKEKSHGSDFRGFLDADQKIVSGWQSFSVKSIPAIYKSDEYRDKCYANVPYEDFSVRQARMKEEGRYEKIGAKILWWFYIFVILIIPFAWFIGEKFFDTIAAFTIVWVLCSFGYRIAKEFAWIKKSDADKKKREQQRTMEHYYYHCE